MTLKDFIGTGIMSLAVTDTPAEKVKEAVLKAGMPEKLVKTIRSADAFKRAMRKLVKEGVIAVGDKGLMRDKVEDSEKFVMFQFTPKFLKERGVNYDSSKAEIVALNKETTEIECENAEIKRVADELFFDAKQTYPASRINDIAGQYCESKFTRLSFRDGVYFVPKNYEEMVPQLRTFFKALGARFQTFAVGQMPDDRENLAASIIADMRQKVQTIKNEMLALKEAKKQGKDGIETNGLTKKIAQNRLRELRQQLSRYRELAQTIEDSGDRLLKAAGEAGDVLAIAESGAEALVAMALSGVSVPPIALELAAAATDKVLPATCFEPMAMPEIKPVARLVPMTIIDDGMVMPVVEAQRRKE